MKTLRMSKKHFKTILITLSSLAIVIITAAFVVPGPVSAAPSQQAAQPIPSAASDNPALTRAFQAEQAFLARQATNLDNTANLITRIQNLINNAKSRSVDTSALEAALTTFQAQVSEARSAHDTAAGILTTHAGFNADGSVSNPAEARQTVQDARKSLQSAATILKQATNDLHTAVKNWRNKVLAAVQSTVLEKAFTVEQNRLGIQGTNLGNTDALVTRVQTLIDNAKAKGVDTSALESALATFQSQVGNARSAHATAAGILSTHAGFNPVGKVTDLTAAKQTVLDARQALQNAASILTQSVKDLKAAVQSWRDAHPQAVPSAAVPGLS
jgi:uncharacterized protein YlxW (UPF0749 family)